MNLLAFQFSIVTLLLTCYLNHIEDNLSLQYCSPPFHHNFLYDIAPAYIFPSLYAKHMQKLILLNVHQKEA